MLRFCYIPNQYMVMTICYLGMYHMVILRSILPCRIPCGCIKIYVALKIIICDIIVHVILQSFYADIKI